MMERSLRNFAIAHAAVPRLAERIGAKSPEEFWAVAEGPDRCWLARALLVVSGLGAITHPSMESFISSSREQQLQQLNDALMSYFNSGSEAMATVCGVDITFRSALCWLGACYDARFWVGNMSLEEAWEKCEHMAWFEWLITYTVGLDTGIESSVPTQALFDASTVRPHLVKKVTKLITREYENVGVFHG